MSRKIGMSTFKMSGNPKDYRAVSSVDRRYCFQNSKFMFSKFLYCTRTVLYEYGTAIRLYTLYRCRTRGIYGYIIQYFTVPYGTVQDRTGVWRSNKAPKQHKKYPYLYYELRLQFERAPPLGGCAPRSLSQNYGATCSLGGILEVRNSRQGCPPPKRTVAQVSYHRQR